MEKLDHYREIIIQLVCDYSESETSYKDEGYSSPLIDRERDHYGVLTAGWTNKSRWQGLVVHIDILNGKVWLQHDGTDFGVAEDLIAAGIPKEDIVLGFHPPQIRAETGFAVS